MPVRPGLTGIVLDIVDLVLGFVLDWNILPSGKECSFLHLSVLSKQNVHRDQAAEVEDIHVVLDCHLQCKSNRWTNTQRKTDIQRETERQKQTETDRDRDGKKKNQ